VTSWEDGTRRVGLDCRIAFRTEGPEVVVYLADATTMDDALVLARINRAALSVSDTLWDDVKAAFSKWLQGEVEKHTGIKPAMRNQIPIEPPEGSA
jgi:hypothetical protein